VQTDDEGETFFIVDISIAPGNSGGPVFDRLGHVAGITVAGALARLGPFNTQLGPMSYPTMVGLSYIIPRSVICKLLADPPAKKETPTS
jgi:S1-C subfamily serine protease